MRFEDQEIEDSIYHLKEAGYSESAHTIELLFDLVKSQREIIKSLEKQINAAKIIVGSFP